MSKRIPSAVAGAIALLTFAVYIPGLWNDFVGWDDDLYVTGNQHIRALDWGLLRWAVSDYSVNYWHPITWISHALDYSLWGLNPAGHHLTSNLLHAVNTFIVVWLVMRLFDAANAFRLRSGLLPALRDRTILMTAGSTGLLFGLHPLHVESVAWVSERKDLLCAFFFLLALLAYLRRFPAAPDTPERGGRILFPVDRHYFLSLLFFICALASKPMAVTLPVVFLILDWYPLGRISSLKNVALMVLEKTAFVIVGLLAAAGAFMAQSVNGYVISMEKTSLAERLLFSVWAFIGYLKNAVVPLHLLPYYQFPETINVLSAQYLWSIASVIGITVWCLLAAKKQRVVTAAWGYYLVTLLPVIGVIRIGTVSFADRFTYLPSLGPFLLLGLAGASAYSRSESLPRGGTGIRILLVLTAFAVVITGMSLTIDQIGVWKDRVTLWSRVIEKGPERIPFAFNNRGAAFLDRGQVDHALSDFNAAISLAPDYADAYNNRGLAFREKGQLDRAIQDYAVAISLNPAGNPSYANRGMALMEKGEYDLAIKDLSMALNLQPDDAELHVERGTAYRELGQFEAAVEDFTRAITLDPSNAQFFIHRGRGYKAMGKMEQALDDYSAAIVLKPSSVEAYNNRGAVYKHLKRLDRALADFDKAVALDPAFSLAYMNRATVLDVMGRADEAIKDYTAAISLQPDFVAAYLYRGELYRKMRDGVRAAVDFQSACALGSSEGCNALRRLTGR